MAKAAVTRSIRDDHQKNFLKIFEGLTGKHNRWEIWRDFIHLTAIENWPAWSFPNSHIMYSDPRKS